MKKKRYPQKRKEIKVKNDIYILYHIPNKLDILAYLQDTHIEDLHRGISSLRNILKDKLIFLEGSTNITKYIVKSCIKCSQKNKNVLKREPSGQIITYYPRQRYVIDLTELPEEFYENKSKIYLFDLYLTVLNNIKKSFKNIGKDFYNFCENEKILLNPKFLIKKKFTKDKPGFLVFNKIKHKKIYKKINATVIKKSGLIIWFVLKMII